MGSHTAHWEDEENNRIVELSVRYQLDGSDLEIVSVTPASVTFVQEESRQPVRRIGIHTAKGREFLLRQFELFVGLDWLQQNVAAAVLAAV